MAQNSHQIQSRKKGRKRHLSQYTIFTELIRSDFRFTVLSHHYVSTMTVSCSNVVCHVTSKLWGRSALFGGLKSCWLELATVWVVHLEERGVLFQCFASCFIHTVNCQILMLSQEKVNTHLPHQVSLATTCVYPYHLSLAFWLLFCVCVCILGLLLLIIEGRYVMQVR